MPKESIEKLEDIEVIEQAKDCTVEKFCNVIISAAERFYRMYPNKGFLSQETSSVIGTAGNLINEYGKLKLKDVVAKEMLAFGNIKYLTKETIKRRILPGIPGEVQYSSKEQLIRFLKAKKLN